MYKVAFYSELEAFHVILSMRLWITFRHIVRQHILILSPFNHSNGSVICCVVVDDDTNAVEEPHLLPTAFWTQCLSHFLFYSQRIIVRQQVFMDPFGVVWEEIIAHYRAFGDECHAVLRKRFTGGRSRLWFDFGLAAGGPMCVGIFTSTHTRPLLDRSTGRWAGATASH